MTNETPTESSKTESDLLNQNDDEEKIQLKDQINKLKVEVNQLKEVNNGLVERLSNFEKLFMHYISNQMTKETPKAKEKDEETEEPSERQQHLAEVLQAAKRQKTLSQYQYFLIESRIKYSKTHPYEEFSNDRLRKEWLSLSDTIKNDYKKKVDFIKQLIKLTSSTGEKNEEKNPNIPKSAAATAFPECEENFDEEYFEE